MGSVLGRGPRRCANMISKYVICLALLLSCLAPLPAAAQELVVDTRKDAQDAAPGDGICADSEGRCTLRAAVAEANTGAADVIRLPAEKIALSKDFGSLLITGDLTIAGAGRDDTRVLGNRIGRIFETAAGVSLSLQDLTLEKGALSARRNPPEEQDGGAIKSNGPLTLTRVLLKNNKSRDGRGGAIFATATVFLNDSECTSNSAAGGGCLWVAASGRVVADGMLFRKNRAFLGGGGGIYVECGSSGNELHRVTTVHNTARKGFSPDFNTEFNPDGGAGGMNLCGDGVIANTAFFRDRCRRCGAGALRIRGGNWLIEHVLFKDNQAHFYTAGAYVDDGAAVQVRATVFEGNDSLNRESDPGFHTGNCHGQLTSLGYNIERHVTTSPSACTLSHPTDLVFESSTKLFSDAKARSAWTSSPAPGSVVIDLIAEGACLMAVDQMNQSRPRDGDGDGIARCDAGPVEAPGPLGPTATASPSPTPTQTAADTPTETPTSTPTDTETPTDTPTPAE